jgi:hypothetical protein
LHQLVYVSTAVEPFSRRDLDALVASARARNEAAAITGFLLHRRGNFLQLLEGDRDAVAALYERLLRDRRHRWATRLLEGAVEARSFPGTPLGYQDLDSAEVLALPGFAEFLGDSLADEEFENDPGRALKLLLLFRTPRAEQSAR